MRKFIGFSALLVMLFALPAFAADTIKIGEIATVTGDFAAYGVAEVESVKMAVAEINAKGGVLGKQLEVVMYDCRTRNEDMVNAARRLVQQDKVVAAIGPSGSGLCIAAAPVFNSGKVAQSFEAQGGKVVADEGHRGEDVDFRAQLTKIKEAKPDVVVLPTMGKCTPLSVKQARELGINVPIIGGDGYGDYFWEIAGAEAMKNTFWVSHVAKEDPALKEFFDKYEKKAGTECQEFMNAVMAYDSVYWLADAITRAGSADPVKVRDALEQTKDLQLMHTKLTMDEFHNPKNKDGYMLEARRTSSSCTRSSRWTSSTTRRTKTVTCSKPRTARLYSTRESVRKRNGISKDIASVTKTQRGGAMSPPPRFLCCPKKRMTCLYFLLLRKLSDV